MNNIICPTIERKFWECASKANYGIISCCYFDNAICIFTPTFRANNICASGFEEAMDIYLSNGKDNMKAPSKSKKIDLYLKALCEGYGIAFGTEKRILFYPNRTRTITLYQMTFDSLRKAFIDLEHQIMKNLASSEDRLQKHIAIIKRSQDTIKGFAK